MAALSNIVISLVPYLVCTYRLTFVKAYPLTFSYFFHYFSIEEVAAAAPKALKWFQLYIYKDRKVRFLFACLM